MIPPFDTLRERYRPTRSVERIGARDLTVTHVPDVNALVDAMGPEDFGPDERLPYWAVLWEAARDLAAWCLEHPAPGAAIIELGAGLGLGSLAAALGGAHVTTSDYEPHALAFALENASLNAVSLEPLLLDWREVHQSCAGREGSFSRAIGADLVYEARNVEPLAEAARFLVGGQGEVVIFDPGRPYFPALVRALEARGFQVETWTHARGSALRAGPFTLRR